VPLDTYRAQGRGGRGIIGADTKEEDFVTHLWSAHTHDTLLFLTSQGRAFAKRVFEVPELSRQSAGRSVRNLLNLHRDETVTTAFSIKEFDDRDILFATRNGTVKKVTLSLLRNSARASGIIACELVEGDEVVDAALLRGGEQVLLASAKGMAIRFPESDVRRMGRTARGVRGIRLRSGDRMVGMVVERAGRTLLTLCEGGYGKRTEVGEYRIQARGGLGVKNIQTTKRNGHVVSVAMVDEADDIVLITAQGMIIRTRVGEVSLIGRNTQGVKVINLKKGDRLLAGAVVAAETDSPEET
jgi:DNA gyrase subunit A